MVAGAKSIRDRDLRAREKQRAKQVESRADAARDETQQFMDAVLEWLEAGAPVTVVGRKQIIDKLRALKHGAGDA